MSSFAGYARYYDLLYRDKDYGGESDYVHELLQKHAPGARSILELGCGTGAHAALLTKHGYEICAVDGSPHMIELAKARIALLPAELSMKLKLLVGDVRNVRLSDHFDAVISLFHVMSYQTTNSDLASAFATASVHLNPGGVFLFDCWYGPAVLTDRPALRVKRLEDAPIEVLRVAEPVMHPNENLVDVNYQILIHDRNSGVIEEVRETHQLRYLFRPEVELLLQYSGLTTEACFEFMTNNTPGYNTWNVCFVGRKK
jgi:SAM-dependent methyltransferase